jgi:two-component system cell cycle response regulator DivK
MQNKRILIVEDNEQNMYLLSFLLGKHGFDILQARDGQQGLDLAAAERPDLILLDIQLPVLDGHEVARRLKQDEQTKNIPIVAVTSHAMSGDREIILAAGCEGYIEKPINPDTFVSQIIPFFKEEAE